MGDAEVVDLSGRLDSGEFRRVVLASDYPPEIREIKADQIIARYKAHPEWPVFGIEISGQLVGFIGLEFSQVREAEICNLAVLDTFRRRGIGSMLIERVCGRFDLSVLSAETDLSAVDFYRRCGFVVQSLGEKYPGTERFWCTLSRGCQLLIPA